MREHGHDVKHVRTGGAVDIGWVTALHGAGEGVRAHRDRQIAYLAYHGKQGMLAWEHVPVRVLERCYDAMGEQMERVAAAMAATD